MAVAASKSWKSPDDRHPELEIIFSSRDGHVWASWPGAHAINLGRHEVVTDMMRDFLAQDALGQRLVARYSSDQ